MNTNIVQFANSDNEFYPTPDIAADLLLSGIDWYSVSSILEPSAGKGNLIHAALSKFLSKTGRRYKGTFKVDCIEKDPYLRSILQFEFQGGRKEELLGSLRPLKKKEETYIPEEHTYLKLTPQEKERKERIKSELETLDAAEVHIVHDDFLSFESRKQYSLIVMNPPFSSGDKHLLKAIQIAKRSGGEVRCILNAETLLNPFSNERKFLKQQLEENNAEVSFHDMLFSNAERKTDVSIAIVKVRFQREKQDSEIYSRLKRAYDKKEAERSHDPNALAIDDFIENIISRFNFELDLGISLIDEFMSARPYLLESVDESTKYNYPNLFLCVGDSTNISRTETPSVNKFVQLTRKKYWNALFHNNEFMSRMTTNIREKYMNMVDKLVDYDFSKFNIQQIMAEMNAELSTGIQDTIVSLFDRMTEKHSWYPECEKNRHYFNGWKTNQVHKIGKKVILPVNGMFSTWYSHGPFELRTAENTIADIEKVFDYLDGDMTAEVSLHGALQRAHEEGRTKNIQCKYFSVTLYKKGTMHIKFHDQSLVDRFNIYCCRKKNWLPPNYGKTSYCDLSEEEKSVVDGFNGTGETGSGEKEYNHVCSLSSYFLSEPSSNMPALSVGIN